MLFKYRYWFRYVVIWVIYINKVILEVYYD